jgi:hypothetical protein
MLQLCHLILVNILCINGSILLILFKSKLFFCYCSQIEVPWQLHLEVTTLNLDQNNMRRVQCVLRIVLQMSEKVLLQNMRFGWMMRRLNNAQGKLSSAL